MAKNKLAVRRVRDEDDRKTGASDYLTLDEGDKFLGFALFKGDPKETEAGYYEFMEHWVPKMNRSVPCAGDDCPWCEAGESLRNRAKTLWLVQKDQKGTEFDPPKLVTFNANSKLIKLFTEMRGEEEPIMGQLFRVSLLSDRGDYGLAPKAGQKITQKEVKEALKGAPDFETMLTQALNKAAEGLAVARAMDDDDEDPDDDDEPKAAKGAKGKGKAVEEEPDETPDEDEAGEWPESLDEEEVIVSEVDDDGNWIEVTSESYEDAKKVWTTAGIEFDLTDLAEGQVVTLTTGKQDSDGEYILSGEPESGDDDETPDADEEGDKDNLPDKIEEDVFEVVKIDAGEAIMDVKNEDLEFTLYFLDSGPSSKVDFDDYEVGSKIKVTAEKDTTGDLVATKVPPLVKAGKGGAKGGKKGGKGK